MKRDPLDDIFFDIWCKSYREGKHPLWVDPEASLADLCALAEKGLIISGVVNGQDDYVWQVTPKGALAGSALNLELLDDQ